jgi:hypothetical protein
MRFLNSCSARRCATNAIVLRCGIDPCSSCYVPGTEGATNSQEMVEEAADALARMAAFGHIRTALLSQLTAA